MSNALDLAREMNRRFVSHNGWPIEKATVPAHEWVALYAALLRQLTAEQEAQPAPAVEAIELLRDLVDALERTNWSSWQTTAAFDLEEERARKWLSERTKGTT